ncbi:hypothetical protein V6N13_086661 [Hibiscus sabdariffa]|uniref:Methyltransferase n=1 Tax=Hibiscus sabdariffa TaxID=183260 RepID=A0ABR2FTU1_9ROSI
MAGLFDQQADLYLGARPTYPSHWYSMLAARTPRHSLAWDVGTGNGQAAIGVAEHYDEVIGTDVSEAQLQHAIPHPKAFAQARRHPRRLVLQRHRRQPDVRPRDEAKRFHDTTLPYWNPNIQYLFDGYKTLPFPFESVGLGSEGKPLALDIPKKLSFEGFLRMLRSWSAVVTAKDQGVDLLSENVVKGFESAWGGSNLVRSIAYKAFMLAGKVKL